MSVNEEEEEVELQSCGCPVDYHMADCPLVHPPTPYENDADSYFKDDHDPHDYF